MENCNHFWVYRKDGYVEQCIPAICIICGNYGCICQLKLKELPKELQQRRKVLFDQLGIDGNNHEIEQALKQ